MYNQDMPPDWMMALATLGFAIGVAIAIWILVAANP